MFHYFLEVSLAWLLLLIVYYVFLRKETFFRSNRLYLMYSMSLGILLPLVRKLPFSFGSDVVSSAPVEMINAGTYHFSHIVDNPQQLGFTWDYQTLLLTIYASGVVFLTFRMFYGLIKILRIWNNSEKIKKGEYTLVVTDIEQLPFSFFKNVFISKKFLKRDYIQKVLEHELVHIKHRHTYDVFIVEILAIVFWWNPLIYIFRKALKETHEYLADAYACLDSDIKNYGHILLGQSSSGIELALTNQFFNSLLKKRINMLNQKKSAGYKMSKYLLAIPLLCFMVVLFSASSMSRNEIDFKPDEIVIDANVPLELKAKLKNGLLNVDLNQNSIVNGVHLGIGPINNLYHKVRCEYTNHLKFIQETLSDFALTQNKILIFEENGNDVHSLILSDVDQKGKVINDGNLRKKLEKEFARIYEQSQVKGMVIHESNYFLKLFLKYKKLYFNQTALRNDFTSIACSFGIKITLLPKEYDEDGFLNFMYVVPKENFKSWKNGEMPQYDEMVCGPNSVPGPPSPPPAPPVPDFAANYNSPNSPLLIVDGEIIEAPYQGKVDFSIRHDFVKMPANVAVEKYGVEARNGAHVIEYNYPTFGIYGVPNGIIYIGEYSELSIKRYSNLHGDIDVKMSSAKTTYNFENMKDEAEGINFMLEEMPANGELIVTVEINGEKKVRHFMVLEKNQEEENSSSVPVIGVESPKDDVLYIGMNNIIKLKTFNVETKNLDYFIASGPEYFKVKSIINDEEPKDFTVNVDAIKQTPLNKPCAITFVFEDGNKITKEFHVRKENYTHAEIDKRLDDEVKDAENKVYLIDAENIKIDVENSDSQIPITLHNGVEVDIKKDDIISVDGYIVHYDEQEGLQKFGPKGKNGVINLVGNIKIENTESQLDSFRIDVTNVPVLGKSNASEPQNNITTFKSDKGSSKKEPLVIIDGKASTNEVLNNLDPDKIKSVNVLKGEKANQKYGSKSKNGVIEVITKSAEIIVEGKYSPSYIITGRVFDDENNKPLIGANVIVEGTNLGTITDLNGNYKLELGKGNHKLIASYVGYKTSESEVEKECDLTFNLVKNDVVVGFENVDENDQSLKIKLNSDVNKFGGKSPLFIIDGIKVDPKFKESDLDPNEIKEITVFKNKEAIEKYGEEAINGVIVITTKQGNFKAFKSILPSSDKLPKPTPLLIVDGIEKTEMQVSDIDTDEVESMNVLKGEKAIEKYGQKGKNGVIEIYTKNKRNNVIILRVIDGIKIDANEKVKLESSNKTYSLSPSLAKEKANVDTDADLVNFIFTKDNQDLEKKMPLKFKLLENPVVDGLVKFEYTTDELVEIRATVISALGQKVESEKISHSNLCGTSSIELNGLTSGMYILLLQTNGISVSEQFIITN